MYYKIVTCDVVILKQLWMAKAGQFKQQNNNSIEL